MSVTVRSTKAIGRKAIQEPDPAAVEAKTEADHHIKAESLRRTNEKIENIEKCIATDTGPEVDIRQTIVGSQKMIDDVKQKKAELDMIIHTAQEAVKQGQEEMKKSKDQKRQHHSVEMEQLVKEQAVKLEELKPAEKALYFELGERIFGYRRNVIRANNVPYSDEYESDESDVFVDASYRARSARRAITNGQPAATVPKAVSASTFNKGKKRTAEIEIEKKSCKSSDKRKFLKEH